MITTTYSRSRAARQAAALAIRTRIAGRIAISLVRALRKLNGYKVTGLLATGKLVTVTQVMVGLGADAELVRRYASHAGKRIKATRLALTGEPPTSVWRVINGRPRQVAAYTAEEPALTAGLAAYDKTAHLVAA